MKLIIISEKTRYHFQKPLGYFSKVKIFHLYKKTYSDSDLKDKCLVKYRNIFDLYSKLKKIKPDLIQGLEPYYGYSRFKIPLKILPILFMTYFFSKRTKTPYFFHILENIPPERKYGFLCGKVMKFIAKKYSDKAAFIFYLNERAKNNLLSMKVNQEKIMPGLWGIWGVDLNVYKPINNPGKKLIFIGSLNNQKGILNLITALPIVRKKIPDIKLEIIGKGPDLDQVKNLITNYDLSKNVKIVGELPSEKIAGHLANSYILVVPSIELRHSAEQVGVVFLEAAACGVPVIATNTGSICEYVKNNITGILVEPSPKALAAAIVKLWQDKKIHYNLARNSRNYALKNFNAKDNIKKLEKTIINRLKELNASKI